MPGTNASRGVGNDASYMVTLISTRCVLRYYSYDHWCLLSSITSDSYELGIVKLILKVGVD